MGDQQYRCQHTSWYNKSRVSDVLNHPCDKCAACIKGKFKHYDPSECSACTFFLKNMFTDNPNQIKSIAAWRRWEETFLSLMKHNRKGSYKKSTSFLWADDIKKDWFPRELNQQELKLTEYSRIREISLTPRDDESIEHLSVSESVTENSTCNKKRFGSPQPSTSKRICTEQQMDDPYEPVFDFSGFNTIPSYIPTSITSHSYMPEQIMAGDQNQCTLQGSSNFGQISTNPLSNNVIPNVIHMPTQTVEISDDLLNTIVSRLSSVPAFENLLTSKQPTINKESAHIPNEPRPSTSGRCFHNNLQRTEIPVNEPERTQSNSSSDYESPEETHSNQSFIRENPVIIDSDSDDESTILPIGKSHKHPLHKKAAVELDNLFATEPTTWEPFINDKLMSHNHDLRYYLGKDIKYEMLRGIPHLMVKGEYHQTICLPVDQRLVKVQWDEKKIPYFQISTTNPGANIHPLYRPFICKGSYLQTSQSVPQMTNRQVFTKVAGIFTNSLRQGTNLYPGVETAKGLQMVSSNSAFLATLKEVEVKVTKKETFNRPSEIFTLISEPCELSDYLNAPPLPLKPNSSEHAELYKLFREHKEPQALRDEAEFRKTTRLLWQNYEMVDFNAKCLIHYAETPDSFLKQEPGTGTPIQKSLLNLAEFTSLSKGSLRSFFADQAKLAIRKKKQIREYMVGRLEPISARQVLIEDTVITPGLFSEIAIKKAEAILQEARSSSQMIRNANGVRLDNNLKQIYGAQKFRQENFHNPHGPHNPSQGQVASKPSQFRGPPAWSRGQPFPSRRQESRQASKHNQQHSGRGQHVPVSSNRNNHAGRRDTSRQPKSQNAYRGRRKNNTRRNNDQ